MTSMIKEMRRHGLSEDNYTEFKEWYSKKYDRRIHDTPEELYKFIKEAEGSVLNQINNEIEEWVEYNSQILKDCATIETFLLEKLNEYFSNLNEYGYIYETRNIVLGDSSVFLDEGKEGTYSIQAIPYSIDINSCIQDESFLDIKKKSVYKIVMDSVNNHIKNELAKSNVNGSIALFEKSVKIVFDDLIIMKNRGKQSHYSLVIKIGIKVL